MLIERMGRTVRRVGTTIAGIGLAIAALTPTVAEAKTPGKTYCFHGVCHRVSTITEMVALVGHDQVLKTSFYDDCKRDRHNPCGLTSSGETFRPLDPDNAASPIYPNGTVLLLRNPQNGATAVVRINNAGPYWGKRKLDVSRGVAESLGFKARGVADLEVRVVSAPTLAEARYKKNRRYDGVPGPIGQYASLDRAQGGMMMAMALNAMSGSLFAPAASKMLPGLKTAKPALANALRSGTQVAALETPLEGLKAAARRAYGTNPDMREKRIAPSSLMADLAPDVGLRARSGPVAGRRAPQMN
ncbi:MAG: septal ring lytic transglycosylase RlpA family protein [Hyphomicrobium sp.]